MPHGKGCQIGNSRRHKVHGRFIGLLTLAMLSACEDLNHDKAYEGFVTAQSPAEARSKPPENRPVVANATGAGSQAAAPAQSVGDIPLQAGVYARVENASAEGPSCPPANASVATFDGKGFGGRNSRNCRFAPAHREGSTWTGTQTCTDTYTGAERSETWAVRAESRTRFTQTNQYGAATFELCPDESLSDWGG